MFVYQLQTIVNNQAHYSQIGSGRFWNAVIDFEEDEIMTGIATKCFPFSTETDLLYLIIHDGGDLAGLDARYNLGSHSCTYFCVYCQTGDKCVISDEDVSYRTRGNLNVNANLYRQAVGTRTKRSPLQISRGVAGTPADPYPGASRITPPLLHIDMGIMTHILKVHTEQIQKLDSSSTNYQQLHDNNLNTHNIFTNRYYNSLEGRQAKEYRKQFSIIASVLSPSPIYLYLSKTVELFNKLMSIIGTTNLFVDEEYCEAADKVLIELDQTWRHTRNLFNISSTLGTKYHYLRHCIDYMRIWRMGIGYNSEQSIENFHKTCTMVFRRYRNQRGLLRVKYAIRQLMFITSPLYQS